MPILDGHIHIGQGPEDRADFVERLKSAEITGGVVLSASPPSYPDAALLSSDEVDREIPRPAQ